MTKFIYKVEPANPSTVSYKIVGDTFSGFLAIVLFLGIFVEAIFIIINLIWGGYGWLVVLGMLGAVYLLMLLSSDLEYKSTFPERKRIAENQAQSYSNQLNDILDKSFEIVEKMLPYFEMKAIESLKTARVDFADNALYPFWERIEETCNYLGCYNEAVNQLVLYGETYTKVLLGKTHSFPVPFPIGINISISQSVLDDFSSIVRNAHTKPDFANIFGHIKTQKVLIAGFQTLTQAINNMSNAIVTSINGLKHSIKSDFRDLKNIQLEQLNSFETSQTAINNTLGSIDTKLYFMQYHKQPITSFVRPLSDHLG